MSKMQINSFNKNQITFTCNPATKQLGKNAARVIAEREALLKSLKGVTNPTEKPIRDIIKQKQYLAERCISMGKFLAEVNKFLK